MKLIKICLAAIPCLVLAGCNGGSQKVTGNMENAVARQYLETVTYPDGNYEETAIDGFDTLKTSFRKDQPAPLVIRWDNDGSWNYQFLVVTTDKKMQDTLFCQSLEGLADSACVFNLVPDRTYWFRINGGKGKKVKLVTKGTLTAEGPLRMIRTDALHNVRDMGGWKTADGKTLRYGLLFRGGQMNRQDPPSAMDIDLMTRQLGIKADVDLRWDSELNGGTPDDPSDDLYYTPLGEGVEYAHMPVNLYDPGNADKAQWNKMLTFVMDHVIAGKPCYIHCAAGADRTGTTCFLLEGLLGVPEQSLSQEYELTSFSTYGRRRRNESVAYKNLVTYILNCEGETIRDKVENYITGYVGIPKEKVEAFREAMLK